MTMIANVRTYQFGIRANNDVMVMVVWGNNGRTGLSDKTPAILWMSRRIRRTKKERHR